MMFVESALAAWRLAHMLVEEDGPWAIFARLRYRAGLRHAAVKGEDGQVRVSRIASNTLAEGLSCVWCVSVWAAALFTWRCRLVIWLRRALAVSAGAILMHEVIRWLRSQ
ncbi:MAG: hypothetical protein Kow0047_15850 [Anaerolineae bacterium]